MWQRVEIFMSRVGTIILALMVILTNIVNARQPKGFKGRMAATMMSMMGKGILTKHLKKSVKADPVVSAQLLRTWINEND